MKIKIVIQQNMKIKRIKSQIIIVIIVITISLKKSIGRDPHHSEILKNKILQ